MTSTELSLCNHLKGFASLSFVLLPNVFDDSCDELPLINPSLKSFGFDAVDGSSVSDTQHLLWSVFCELKSLFCPHRLQSLLAGRFALCVVVRRGLGGGAGEEDEVIFGLKDLRETELVKPRLNVSNSRVVALLRSRSLLEGNYRV